MKPAYQLSYLGSALMKTADFEYELPIERIAQIPTEPRDHSRLMVLQRATGSIEHRHFFEIEEYLHPGDVLVLNNSRVIPARLLGRKINGGAKVDLLLLHRAEPGIWEALAKPGRRLKKGTQIEIKSENLNSKGEHILAEVLSKTDVGTILLHFNNEQLLERLGTVPLPPYIHTQVRDPERYQTVYAETKGSVAAPTAGLHFTPSLMDHIKSNGIEFVFVTLHVGLGSFRPVKVEDPREHPFHQEYCKIGTEEAQKLNQAKREGRRIICVGTTTVRAVEGATGLDGEIRAYDDWNNLYILPGYQFRNLDALITNFHLPHSTLLMLVAAFTGREQILQTYGEAIRMGYRFYSFGDAMLVL